MHLKIEKLFSKYTFYFLIFLIFSIQFNFFSNLYKIIMRSYDERIGRTYGYACEKYSYGFVTNIKENYLKDSKVHIINFAILPDVKSLFIDLKKDKEKKNLILLNYNFEIDKNYKNLKDRKIDISEYNQIFKYKDCFFLKKK